MLVLALSDAHIPDRAIDLPLKLKKLLSVPNKISQVILLGNCTKSYEFLKFVNEVSSNVVIVRGEYDNGLLPAGKPNRTRESIPINTVVKQGDFKIGCCSGYTVVPKNDPLSLLALARQLDVDLMLWGGTHNVEAFTLEGKFFVNPGSCTGAFNTDWPFSSEDEQLNKTKQNDPKTVQDEVECDSEQKAEQSTEEPKTEQEVGQRIEKEFEQSAEEEAKQESKQEAQESETEKEENLENSKEEGPKEEELVEDDLELPELEIDGSNTPSFCLLDIQGSTCTLYIYIYVDGEVKVDKVVYRKEE